MDAFEHQDVLAQLNTHAPLKDKLITAHTLVEDYYPFIARVAITLYDPQTRVLKTYLHSSGDSHPLEHYKALIDDAPSLKEILKKRRPRVINNLVTQETDQREHSRRFGREGYAASYTLPMFNDGAFFGFLFFNSTHKDVFTEPVLRQLDIFGHLISLMVLNEISSVDIMSAAVRTTTRLTHVRDPETGSHLDRMSRYSRVIAEALADQYQLDDDYIEHVFMFAPLHDIGKIAIPDSILLKPDALNDDEKAIMRTHSRRGRELIDEIISNFKLDGMDHMDILRNIAEYHHEAVNGTGYPEGRAGNEVPLEARIVAVADVFDALTSRRPYKQAWANDKALQTLLEMADEKLDKDCVNALLNNLDQVVEIQQQFQENSVG